MGVTGQPAEPSSMKPPAKVRNVIVTGAAQGIGLGIAQVLAEADFAVALADVQGDLAEAEAAKLRGAGHKAIGIGLDVSADASWKAALAAVEAAFGPVDALVNNAGISPRGTAEMTDEALWERCLSINLKGSWLGIRAVLPGMRARPVGRIVNIGSTPASRPLRRPARPLRRGRCPLWDRLQPPICDSGCPARGWTPSIAFSRYGSSQKSPHAQNDPHLGSQGILLFAEGPANMRHIPPRPSRPQWDLAALLDYGSSIPQCLVPTWLPPSHRVLPDHCLSHTQE